MGLVVDGFRGVGATTVAGAAATGVSALGAAAVGLMSSPALSCGLPTSLRRAATEEASTAGARLPNELRM